MANLHRQAVANLHRQAVANLHRQAVANLRLTIGLVVLGDVVGRVQARPAGELAGVVTHLPSFALRTKRKGIEVV